MRSEFLFPSAVWNCVHPPMPLRAPEFTLRAALTLIVGKDQRAVLRHSSYSGDKYPESVLSLWKFLYAGILFQVWGTMSCPCFCKISTSNRTISDPMGAALKGTRKGQHARYMALLKGQIHITPSESYLPKVNCCSLSCLETKLQPPGSCSITAKKQRSLLVGDEAQF